MFVLFPFLYRSIPENPEAKRFTGGLLPPFWYTQSGPEKSLFLAGTYFEWGNNKHYSNFFFLYSHTDRENYRKDSLIFDLIKYERTSSMSNFSAGWRILGGWEIHDDRYNWNVANLISYRNSRSRMFGFIPLFWKYSTQAKTTYAMPGLLSWMSFTQNNTFRLFGLGTVWYENVDHSEHDGTRLLLLGSLYHHVLRPEREYESRGSLWGWLWKYEKENTTDYSHFSALKILYSTTRFEGTREYRVLGIRLWSSREDRIE
jgi:hypothetical protein